jgi:hypothetical protein
MEIHPIMVKDALENIIHEELGAYLEDYLGLGTAIERCAIKLTQHAYSFAELPDPNLSLPELPRP